MATMEKINLVLASPNRVEVETPFSGNASWFDLMMHAVGLTDSTIYWDYEYINQLDNEHHRCMAIICREGVDQLAMLIDEMVQMFSNDMLRQTLFNMRATAPTSTWTDHSQPYEANPVLRQHGWILILPNVVTNAIHNVRHQLPVSGGYNEIMPNMYEGIEI